MNLEIRPAVPDDVNAVREIYANYILNTTVTFEYAVPSVSDFDRRFDTVTAIYPWLVALSDGKIIGYAYADRPFSDRTAYCFDADLSVYLSPSFAGVGVGSRLYQALIEILCELGYRNVYGIVSGEKAVSIAFHEKMGFRRIGIMENSGFKFNRWLDVVWFEKRISELGTPDQPPMSISELSSKRMRCICEKYCLCEGNVTC
ncbi:MAG: GNAT family N-acetyltransferase [Eubacteriales bacterium]